MKRTLIFLLSTIAVSASAQKIENVLDTTNVTTRDFSFGIRKNLVDFDSPLFILGEVEIKQEQLSKIDPNQIRSIHVLKDSAAVAQYGEKGKSGVVIIEMKNPDFGTNQIPDKKE